MNSDIIMATENIHHAFGETRVLFDVNLRVRRGQILSLVGPSGCGKSTLLRAIIGTHAPNQGRVVMFDGELARTVRGAGRDRGIVYQRYALFPFLTAQQNVALGLMLDQTTIPGRLFRFFSWRQLRKQHLEEAAALLEKLQLADALNHYPHELSGGMRQRVAVAQALIMKPQVLLMDEPFGALDEATREELNRMLLRLAAENRTAHARGDQPPYTIVIVTHELNEAIYVGDRVVGLSQYWNWKDAADGRCPGATIVYDHAAPVFEPGSERSHHDFSEQRQVIREQVFDPSVLQDPATHCAYWNPVPSPGGVS
jgi:NitT/TauT family transport system ATP-binding protein